MALSCGKKLAVELLLELEKSPVGPVPVKISIGPDKNKTNILKVIFFIIFINP